MLKTFKMRIFLAILIVAMASISVRSADNQAAAKLVLEYVLKDYGIQQGIVEWAAGWAGYPTKEVVPAISRQNMQIPCEFIDVDQSYGWRWNSKTAKEELYPGIRLRVSDNTLVRPVMDGQVIELGNGPEGRTILIQHQNNISSSYSGLKELFVEKGSTVSMKQALGKSNTYLYFEIRGLNGPIDPQLILE